MKRDGNNCNDDDVDNSYIDGDDYINIIITKMIIIMIMLITMIMVLFF